MKNNVKLGRAIALLIMMGLVVGSLLVFAQAINVDVGVTNLGVDYSWDNGKNAVGQTANYTPTIGNKALSFTVKSAYRTSVLATQGTIVLTLTNNYESDADLEFDWKTTGYGDSNVNGDTSKNTDKHCAVRLSGHSSITLQIVSAKSKDGRDTGITLSIWNIELTEYVVDVSTTFLPPEQGGSYSVDNEAVTAKKTYTNKSNHVYQLTATPAAGYVFAGWKNADTNAYLSTEASWSTNFTENTRILPVFVSEDSAQFGVGDQKFFDLNVANNYAVSQSNKTIVLLKGGTLPKDTYTISSGVTLLIPYSDSTTVNTTKPSTVDGDNPSNQSAFRTMTVSSGTVVNVDGAICVNGQVLKNKSIPTGLYGLITLEPGAKINLNNGANLYCWGYINGDGDVIANNGATVYECFQLTGWRGGSASTDMLNNKQKVFFLNQFYIQNVEAALTFNYGATEMVYASVVVAKVQCETTETFIAANAGMFRIRNDKCHITKKYIPAMDRMAFSVDGEKDGEMYISPIELDLSVDLLIYTAGVKIESKKYVLPIPSNFSVDVHKGTTTITSDQAIAVLPGAEFTVSEGATFKAASDMYVYDRDEWKGKGYAGQSRDYILVNYSATRGTDAGRSDKDLVDATIDVNGTLLVSGKIYTTLGGANIFSSQGTGKICFDSTYEKETSTDIKTYQATQNGTTVSLDKAENTIQCNPAWLRNGDGTYTETAGAQAGWTYKYDTVQQRWYRFRVDYQFNGKNIGYDLITTDSSDWDVSFADGDLVGTVTSGMANTPTISDGTLKVTGVGSDCTINITGVAASYTPYFVLNEHQYGVYRSYGGAEISQKAEIGGKTYYVVKACGTLEFGSALEAPSDEAMGVSVDRHNSITWFLEDVTTGAQQFMGTVPSGKDKGKPVYIYGIYTGAVAHNSYTNEYYTNLKDAIVDLPVTGSATLTMYANCGTFEDESKTASYSLSANITFDVNGKEVWGSLVNNGTLTLDLNGGSVRYITGATAGSKAYRASATVINNGTMTIQDFKGGGVISTDAVCDDGVQYDLKNHASAIRNLGKLTMESVSVAVDQSVNDWVTAVMNYNGGVITSMNNCSVVCTRGYGITNYGGTIQTISGGTINGGDAAMAGRFGIQNRNIRSGSGTDAAPYVISKLGTIDTISGLTVYVYQYGINNYATVNHITGSTKITATGGNAIRNQVGWYDTSQTPKVVTTEANNVKTMVYTYDTVNFPTIKEISGNVTVTANGSYAIWNSGNIEKISGDMNGDGVLITRPNGNYTLENSGYIGEISGKVTIYSSGAYVLMQNIWGSTNSRQIGRTYIQRDVGGDGDYTSVGDIREYTDEYTAPVIDKIGGENSEVTISGTSSVLYNYGTINTIAGGVTVTARTGSSAVINGSGGQQTVHSVRTNLGKFKFLEKDEKTKKDKEAERYETRIEDERTYYRAKIGSISSISGDITIQSLKSSGALVNGGTIDSIGSGVKLQATSSVLQNNSYTFEQQQYVYLGYSKTSVFGASSEAGRDYAYTAAAPVITLIDGPTIQATSGDHAIVNGGTIGTIQNATISAKGAYAINNSSNIITERKIFKDSAHTTAYALTELFDAFFTKDAATGKYTSVAASATPNHVDSYGVIPTITVIGAGNTISATKQTIYNKGEITNIDSSSATKTSITATDQGTSGQAIYNLSALAGTKTFTDGSTGVDGDYKTPAHIGIIQNVNVTAAYRAIQNGDAGNYLNVIDEIGANTDARATGNVKDGAAVYNADKNAQIKSITNGTYTAATPGNYAVYNAGMTYAITIEGGYFKGGLADTANRAHAIYEPDKTERQSYPEGGYTLSNKPNKDGYYYITNKFTIKFDPNDSADEPMNETPALPDKWTVDLSATGNINVPTAKFTRKGYIFQGWGVKDANGTESIIIKNTDTTISLDTLKKAWSPAPAAGDEVTLYAIWQPDKVYSVTVSWSKGLEYTYIPNVYTWNATEMRYEHTQKAGWIGTKDSNPTVTISNGGDKTDVTYGHINADIQYTSKAAAYDGFTMDFLVDNKSVGKGSATLAKKLAPKNSVTTTMKLEGTPFSGMNTGKPITIGTVTLTLTTAD